jgi:PAT family beta-lactamase induction signal transducer AmpG
MQSPNANLEAEARREPANFRDRRVLTMLFLGFSAGIPLLLIFSSLSLWLREAGVERNAVTFFSWAALGYSFKFVWAPLVDRLPLPWLTRGASGVGAAGCCSRSSPSSAPSLLMASVDPAARAATPGAHGPGGGDAGLLGGDPGHLHRRLPHRVRAAGAAGHALGGLHRRLPHRHGHQRCRCAVPGGAVLSSPDSTPTAWSLTYSIMAGTMLVGITTTLVVPEPERSASSYPHPARATRAWCWCSSAPRRPSPGPSS